MNENTKVTEEYIPEWKGTEHFYDIARIDKQETDKKHYKQILEYINQLYLIEILRHCEVTHLDLQIAWQMGKLNDEPWIDSPQLVKTVMGTKTKDMYYFLNSKFAKAVGKLLKGLEGHNDEHYLKTPLTQALIDSIMSGFDQLMVEIKQTNNLGNIPNWFEYDFSIGSGNEFEWGVPIRHDYSEYTDLQVVERLLIGWFDTYTDTYDDLDYAKARRKYGAARKEILDNRVYLCYKCLLDKYKDIKETVLGEGQARRMSGGDFYIKCSAWACLLSILYRLSIPCDMHPARLDRMYDHYILTNPKAVKALQYGRKYGGCTAEQVIYDSLIPLECTYLPENLRLSGYSLSGTYPNSIIERYLVTQYLLEKDFNNCQQGDVLL